MNRKSDRTRELEIWIGLAILFSLFFLRSTYISFQKIRLDLLKNEINSTGNQLDFHFQPAPEKEADLLLLTIRNNASSKRQIEIFLNSVRYGEFIVSAQSSKTYTFAVRHFEPDNTLVLHSNASDWVLKAAQLRNLYGSLKNILFTWVIVDRNLGSYSSPSSIAALAIFVALLLFGLFGTNGISMHKPRLHSLPLITVVLLFLLVSMLPFFSQYRLLFSIKTFLICVIVCYFPAIKQTYIRPQSGRGFQSALIVLTIFIFFYLSMLHWLNEHQGNYSGFLYIGKRSISRNALLRDKEQLLKKLIISNGGGYDGQFFYSMAFDPFLQQFKNDPSKYKGVVDNAPYRYRRIGFPLLVKLFSLDHPDLYPKTMVLLILFSHLVGAFFFVKIVLHFSKNPAWGLLYLLIPTFTVSLRVGLPESIAAAFLLGGIYFYLRGKWLLSLLLFSFSLLIRETTSLAVFLIAPIEFFKSRNIKKTLLFLTPFVPYFAWRLFVAWRLFGFYGWSGFFYEPPNLTFPYFGIATLIRSIADGVWPGENPAAGFVFPILLTVMFVLSVPLVRKRKDLLTIAFCIYSLLALSLSYRKVWLAVGNAERLTFASFLFCILVFFSLGNSEKFLQRVFFCFFILLLIYNWFFLSTNQGFRAGFGWDFLS